MTIVARSAVCLALATAAAVAAMADAAASRATAGVPVSATDTGRPNEFVNRPGCWTGSGYALRAFCSAAGAQE
jgi:hypothetical protein